MAPYAVPLFASPSKTHGRHDSSTVRLGGLGQPLTPDAFERLPQLLTAASSDEEDDALAWRGGLDCDVSQRLGALDSRPSWDAQPTADGTFRGACQTEDQQTSSFGHSRPADTQQQYSEKAEAPLSQPTSLPTAMQGDLVHGDASSPACQPEGMIVQQVVLAMQVRQTCHHSILYCVIVPLVL